MDAFVFPCPEWLSSLSFVQSLSKALNLPTLPAHIHYILLAFCTYHLIFLFISPFFSRLLLPNIYPNFNKRTKVNWDVHVVSFIQSTFISILALWVIFNDEERAAWREQGNTDAMLGRVFGETPMCGAVTGYAAGYFLWDLFMSGYYLNIFGPGFLAHAASAVAVYSLGFVSLSHQCARVSMYIPRRRSPRQNRCCTKGCCYSANQVPLSTASIRKLLCACLCPLRAFQSLP